MGVDTPKLTQCMSRPTAIAFTPPPHSVLIAITDPKSTPVPGYSDRWNAILGVEMWDDDCPPADVWPIYTFIRKYYDYNIFAHCEMGVSRSGAIREFLHRRGWKFTHMNWVAIPNPHILRHLEFFDRFSSGRKNPWPWDHM